MILQIVFFSLFVRGSVLDSLDRDAFFNQNDSFCLDLDPQFCFLLSSGLI